MKTTRELAQEMAESLYEVGVEIDSAQVEEIFSEQGAFDLNNSQLMRQLGWDINTITDEQRDKLLKRGFMDTLAALNEQSFRRDLEQADIDAYTAESNITVEPENASMDAASAGEVIAQTLRDEEATFYQGYHWNVLLSDKSSYALKFVKYNTDALKSAHEEVEQYRAIEQVFEDEFLLKQFNVKLKNTDREVVLQEKLDLEEWRPISVVQASQEDVANMVPGLDDAGNREKFSRFISYFEQLEAESNLVIDLNGDNVFCRVDESGELEVKILDYGCFEVGKNTDSIQKSKQLLAELEKQLG